MAAENIPTLKMSDCRELARLGTEQQIELTQETVATGTPEKRGGDAAIMARTLHRLINDMEETGTHTREDIDRLRNSSLTVGQMLERVQADRETRPSARELFQEKIDQSNATDHKDQMNPTDDHDARERNDQQKRRDTKRDGSRSPA